MPVQYTPQFIPTNTQALQSVLGEYQKAYDQNAAIEAQAQDAYSMIPTLDAGDTAVKNSLLEGFSNKMTELTKKYNYDRANSGFSRDLAKEISNIRKDPFWTYNERKKEISKSQEEDKRRLGAFYFAADDPTKATYKNQEALNKYQPLDIRDLMATVGATAKEKATSLISPINRSVGVYNKATGRTDYYAELGEQIGYETDEKANEFLTSKEGDAALRDWVKGTAFEGHMDNPTIYNAAMNAARQNLVGQKQTSFSRMEGPPEPKATTPAKTPKSWIEVDNTGRYNPTTYKSEKILEQSIAEKEAAGEPLNEDDLTAIAIVEEVKNTDLAQETYANGITRLGTVLTGRGANVDEGVVNDIFSLLESSFKNTTLTGRAISNSLGKKHTEDNVAAIAESLNGVIFPEEVEAKDEKQRTRIHNRIARDLAKSTYDEFTNFYNTEYTENITRPIKKALREGTNYVASEYAAPSGDEPGAKEAADFVSRMRVHSTPVNPAFATSKDSKMWDDAKVTEFYNNVTANGGKLRTVVSMDHRGLPIVKIGSTNFDETMDLKFDPERTGYDIYGELAYMTGKPQVFMDALLSNFPERVQDFDQTLNLVQSTLFLDPATRDYYTDEEGKLTSEIKNKLSSLTAKDISNRFSWKFEKGADNQNYFFLSDKTSNTGPIKINGKLALVAYISDQLINN